ncbi:MAG: hypothetical protein ACD_2C00184G0005 [uncultured bacterium (gcode 4)]|uniref:Uncharacterized protein n=1 Tax=uncultured bacterium (gcode 4) TaxID=1234023 RepID=K2G2D2_9BACT|nr:MAG: hypothetical protein ACD_2C00184G0005 [uncultured bacterium (gcode 4)]
MFRQRIKWFTLVETVIAMAIIWVVFLAIFRSYVYMMTVNRQFAQDMNFNNYSEYVTQLFSTSKLPAMPDWTTFYLYFTWSNSIATTTDSSFASWGLDFFSDSAKDETHSIIKNSSWSLNWVQFDFYEVNTSDSNKNNKKNYVIR